MWKVAVEVLPLPVDRSATLAKATSPVTNQFLENRSPSVCAYASCPNNVRPTERKITLRSTLTESGFLLINNLPQGPSTVSGNAFRSRSHKSELLQRTRRLRAWKGDTDYSNQNGGTAGGFLPHFVLLQKRKASEIKASSGL
jgi:hypothetical protein